ncbi:poly-beta-1,6 N-acetyl-D-glucosamine export porin PgaA [Microbulbifer sp. SAOS-129_SWC]|uniref:poly-beta-1,6 N-acetyl-D-glucosamine export porin PgaA n=1 Tax=Microbulbifer sp. SAOS-129_SWC TaxID=3145235 RepID=UPI0032163895
MQFLLMAAIFSLPVAALAESAATATPAPADASTSPSADSAGALLERGRAAFRDGDHYTALRYLVRARALAPDNVHIRRAIADVIMELNAPYGAAAALEGDIDIGIRSRQAALKVRWGEHVETSDPRHRFDATDTAIADLQSLLDEAENATPRDRGLITRLRRDLTLALRDRERWQDALAQAEILQAAGDTLPPYVREAQADAMLALRHPARALAAYDEVLAADPHDRNARVGKFYAEIELEDFEAAFATADTLAAEASAWRRGGVDGREMQNSEWLDNQVLAAQARRYGDMPAEAWRRIAPIADAAPAAAWLRAEKGEAAAARDWPRLGHEELLIARSLAPDDVGIRLDTADSLMRRRYWRAAEAEVQTLATLVPGNTHLWRLQRDIDTYHQAELRLQVQPKLAHGGGPDADGDEQNAVARLYSPPLGERWRIFGEAAHNTSRPTNKTLTRNRAGGGVEGRWPDVTLEAAAWSNSGELDQGGGGVNLNWQPDDHWSFEWNAQRYTLDTPLRALEAGVRADSAAFSTLYAWHESRALSAAVTAINFTDGNRRRQLLLEFGTKVYDSPKLDIFLRPELYASRNSLLDAPYFNPRRDASLTVGVDIQHRIWRRYECSLSQRLQLNAGRYWQRDHGSGTIGSATYSQIWRVDPRSEVNYGIEAARRLYDGNYEYSWSVFLGFDQRF